MGGNHLYSGRLTLPLQTGGTLMVGYALGPIGKHLALLIFLSLLRQKVEKRVILSIVCKHSVTCDGGGCIHRRTQE